jgi:UDP-N-acetylglucosamine--N-acetylmuramyl-(pentapeptide) pyrophosphoryl-undecaprenol N-acetylglucosamine transferase
MAQALAGADLAVMRAGASTLGELPAARLPSILIPGGFSDQRDNALFLESQGAAVMLAQERLDDLQDLAMRLLGDAPRLQAMRDALRGLARPDAADNLARLVAEMAAVKENVSV